MLDVPASNGVVSFNSLKIDADQIAFNYDTSGCSEDALNIRNDHDTAIDLPEFVKSTRTNAAAYVANTAINILVHFQVGREDITSIKVKGIANNRNGALGDTEEKLVVFSNRVSQTSANDVPAWPEFVKFALNGKIPAKICATTNGWDWIVTEINGISVNNLPVSRTSGHVVYSVLAAPMAAPWTQTANDPCNAWVTALDLVCGKGFAGGATSTKEVAGKIVEAVYKWGSYAPDSKRQLLHNGNLMLSYHLAHRGMVSMNCEDVADIVTALGNVVGCANQSVKLERDWVSFKSNKVAPLHGPLAPPYFITDDISYHAVTTGPVGIFDACYGFEITGTPNLKWAKGISLDDYLNWLVPTGETKPTPKTPWSPTIR